MLRRLMVDALLCRLPLIMHTQENPVGGPIVVKPLPYGNYDVVTRTKESASSIERQPRRTLILLTKYLEY